MTSKQPEKHCANNCTATTSSRLLATTAKSWAVTSDATILQRPRRRIGLPAPSNANTGNTTEFRSDPHKPHPQPAPAGFFNAMTASKTSPETVAKIIRDAMMAIPKPRNPVKKKTPATVSLKHAKADFSSAKITHIPLPKAPPNIVRNALVRAPYVPRELDYRGRQ